MIPRHQIAGETSNKLPLGQEIEKISRKPCIPALKYACFDGDKELQGDNTWRLIASKFGELSVSTRHNTDLLDENCKIYQRYLENNVRGFLT